MSSLLKLINLKCVINAPFISIIYKMIKTKYELWRVNEDLRYHFYLILNIDKLTDKKPKIENFYIDMSRFVGRNPTQCKTHHQKKMLKYQNIQ